MGHKTVTLQRMIDGGICDLKCTYKSHILRKPNHL